MTSRILSQPAVSEVVIIDDGSTDRSAAIGRSIAAADAKVRFLRHETNLGEGAAIRTGLRVVRTEFTVIQDADLEYDPDELADLLSVVRSERCACFGSRYLTRRSRSSRHEPSGRDGGDGGRTAGCDGR